MVKFWPVIWHNRSVMAYWKLDCFFNSLPAQAKDKENTEALNYRRSVRGTHWWPVDYQQISIDVERVSSGPLYYHVLTLIPGWISNYIHHRNYLYTPKLQTNNRWSLGWISTFIPQFTGHVITYFMLGLKLNHVSKRCPWPWCDRGRYNNNLNS